MPVLRRALVVGVNNYDQLATNLSQLSSAARDASRLAPLLESNTDGSPNWIVTNMNDADGGKITRPQLKKAVTDLFRPSPELLARLAEEHGTPDADPTGPVRQELLFYFSGHAAVDAGGTTRLYAYDDDWYSFVELMDIVSKTRAESITIVLDCCMSGNVGHRSLSTRYQDPLAVDLTLIPDNACILTASRPNEEAQENGHHGVFSEMLIGALEGAAADILGEVTSLGLYSHASGALGYDGQRPMFKANIEQPVLLRTVEAKVPAWSLHVLPDVFRVRYVDGTRSVLPVELTEAHEGIPGQDQERMSEEWVEFGGSEEQTVLDHLKLWRGANLVYTPSGKDFYKLTNESRPGDDRRVVLTPMGLHYRRLAESGAFADAVGVVA